MDIGHFHKKAYLYATYHASEENFDQTLIEIRQIVV